MTSKELVLATLAGNETPRSPAGPLAVHFCARLAGITLRQYSTNAAALAGSVIAYYGRFQPDAVWVSADTWVGAEAMGAAVGAQEDDQPLGGIGPPRIQRAADIDRIPPPDIASHGRYPMMIDALDRVVSALGREVFVVACFDQYPFSLAAALMGLDRILLKAVEDAPMVEALMERALEYSLAYAKALSAAGAAMLSGGDSPAGLLGPRLYEQLALPFERRLIHGLQTATAKPVSLHICGQTAPILPGMATSGADVLELDHAVDLRHACEVVGPDVALWGNLDPVGLLAQSSPQEVEREADRALAAAASMGHRRFVLSSGCTLAVETPADNLEALIRACRQPPRDN